MLGSKSKCFFQSAEALKLNRIKLITYLEINDYSQLEINVYCKVFDYFCINPSHYDGATIVKDLYHINNLFVIWKNIYYVLFVLRFFY